jgi:hypothetical protein
VALFQCVRLQLNDQAVDLCVTLQQFANEFVARVLTQSERK